MARGPKPADTASRWAAVPPTEEAVAAYRRLAETDPNLYLPFLAAALNNLGVLIAQLGDVELTRFRGHPDLGHIARRKGS